MSKCPCCLRTEFIMEASGIGTGVVTNPLLFIGCHFSNLKHYEMIE